MLLSKVTQHIYRNSYISYVSTAFGAFLVVWLLHGVAPQKFFIPLVFPFPATNHGQEYSEIPVSDAS